MKRYLILIATFCLLLSCGQLYAQNGTEIGAGQIVDALTLPLTLLVGWLLRKFAFPALNGFAFLGILILIVTPVLAWLVGFTSDLYNAPGHSYLQSVLYGLLSVVVHQIKVQWDNWRNGTREGMRRAITS
jgi:hypothetical protein